MKTDPSNQADKEFGNLLGSTVVAESLSEDMVALTFSNNARLAIYNSARLNELLLTEADSVRCLHGLILLQCVQTKSDLLFIFLGGDQLRVDLSDESYRGPEALQLITSDGRIIVWN